MKQFKLDSHSGLLIDDDIPGINLFEYNMKKEETEHLNRRYRRLFGIKRKIKNRPSNRIDDMFSNASELFEQFGIR